MLEKLAESAFVMLMLAKLLNAERDIAHIEICIALNQR